MMPPLPPSPAPALVMPAGDWSQWRFAPADPDTLCLCDGCHQWVPLDLGCVTSDEEFICDGCTARVPEVD